MGKIQTTPNFKAIVYYLPGFCVMVYSFLMLFDQVWYVRLLYSILMAGLVSFFAFLITFISLAISYKLNGVDAEPKGLDKNIFLAGLISISVIWMYAQHFQSTKREELINCVKEFDYEIDEKYHPIDVVESCLDRDADDSDSSVV